MGLSFLTLAIVSSAIGPVGFAAVVTAQVSAQFSAYILSGAIPHYLIHDIAKSLSLGQGTPAKANIYVWHSLLAVPCLLLLSGATLLMLPAPHGEWIGVWTLLTAAHLVNEFGGAVLTGAQRFIRTDTVGLLYSALTLAGVVAIGPSLTPVLAVAVTAGATAACGVLRLALIYGEREARYLRPVRGSIVPLYKYAAPLLFAGSAGFLVYRLHYVLVAALASPAVFGTFALAQQIAEKAWLPAQAVASVLFPSLSTRPASAIHALTTRLHYSALASGALSLAGVLVVCAIPSELLLSAFGADFVGLPAFIASMSIGIGAWGMVKVYAAAIAATGAFYRTLWISLTTIVFTTTFLGLLGLLNDALIGWGLSLGYVAGLILAWYYIRSPP